MDSEGGMGHCLQLVLKGQMVYREKGKKGVNMRANVNNVNNNQGISMNRIQTPLYYLANTSKHLKSFYSLNTRHLKHKELTSYIFLELLLQTLVWDFQDLE